MRVVIASISFCEYVIQQANSLAGLGHRVLLVIPEPLIENTVGEDIGRLLAPNVKYYSYNVVGKWRKSFYVSMFNAISAFSPDILHVHNNGEVETLTLVVRYPQLPMVVTVHDVTAHPGADSQIKLRRRLVKRLLKWRANMIHLHGKELLKKLHETDPKFAAKSRVIPHGTLSLFTQWEYRPVKREPLTCLYFGRMEKYRGLDNLLAIGNILKETLPGIRIVVAGSGSELEKYKAEMAASGIFEIHDTFIQNRDVHRFFRRASLLLLPYHEASQSGVMMMGLPFGVPIVATDVGSISEIVVDGQHGRIVPVGDLDGFAGAVRELMSDEGRWERMRAACLRLAESQSFARLAGDFENMYMQAIAAKKK